MFNLLIIFLSITSPYLFLSKLFLYILICGNFFLWFKTKSIDKNKLEEILTRVIPKNVTLNINLTNFQITSVFVILAINNFWELSLIWIITAIIQYKVIYQFMNKRGKYDN